MRFLRPSLAFEFVCPIHADRAGLIALRLKTFFLTVENVVSRDRDEDRVDLATGAREIFRAERIYLLSFFGICFATVNIGPRGAIDDGVRTLRSDLGFNRAGVSDVECLVVVT